MAQTFGKWAPGTPNQTDLQKIHDYWETLFSEGKAIGVSYTIVGGGDQEVQRRFVDQATAEAWMNFATTQLETSPLEYYIIPE